MLSDAMVNNCIIGITPFESPDINLVAALVRAGAIGVLDLGRDIERAIEAIHATVDLNFGFFGVRIPEALCCENFQLPTRVNLVIVELPNQITQWCSPERQIWIQVCSREEMQTAIKYQPHGIIIKGSEASGRVGTDSSFILLQQAIQLKNSGQLNIPFWVQGGLGIHGVSACIAAGVKGIVLDMQLALLKDCGLPEAIKKIVLQADNIETKVIHGHRIFSRPDLKLPNETEIAASDFIKKLSGLSIQDGFLPMSQDILFARGIGERFISVRSLVNSLKRTINGHIRQAKAIAILNPESPMAMSNGTYFPIAQGPMTRVSDRAEFINSVAKNGALPFLALSMMGKDQSREILKDTAKLLAGKPWGVGILGFVPEELQQAQQEALAEFKPSVLLIAGGQPAQAEIYEKRGIRTFLHVPSAGLLKKFLKEGSRRFIFEGRECGGHVGPRTSFILWEMQIEILLASEVVHELEVFFAGGIHDAVSSAFIAVMSAPLAARGAKVGVLLGTAYLFTKEAVETGAITDNFQKQAMLCQQTALLESGPGHVTRCATSPYVEKFAFKKKELHKQMSESSEVKFELENLNVGRLRVAAKGMDRINGKLVSIDQTNQQEEGLFMMGQVAELRNQLCTMKELHAEISLGSQQLLEKLELQFKNVPIENPKNANMATDVAIVGMACVVPGAQNLDEFWRNILAGKSHITEVPESRWSKETYFEANSTNPGKSISKWGGFIDEMEFDPLEFGIPPNSMSAIEPVQILSLKIAKQALADAGYADKVFDRDRTSVIFGAEAGTDLAGAYGFRALYPQFVGKLPKELNDFLPQLTEDSFPGVLANVIAGRIANRLDLGGTNFTVDAACASSIAALDLSIKELRCGESDMVLCGGADLHNSINDYLMFSSVHALSPTGKSQPFSADANGIVLGEGVAVVVLKRLQDAERDQDRIYSVIKGVGSSSDGKSLGLTAPRKDGQIRALTHAYNRAGIDPSEIELVEAHGTGTVVGDRTELESLTEVYSEAGALRRSCALGSVKSQVGHLKCAAGLAGIIKTSLSLYHAIIPPAINLNKPNPFYSEQSSPFFFAEAAMPWLTAHRKAAVSAFGFGGTNFHTVLASHNLSKSLPAHRAWPAELFLFADSEELKTFKSILDAQLNLDFSSLALSLWKNKKRGTTFAIVASDITDLNNKINCALEAKSAKGIYHSSKTSGENKFKGKIAFLFSGQGSQSLNMGADFFNSFPFLRKYLNLGAQWAANIYPKGKDLKTKELLNQTSTTQPALGIIELALLELIKELGIEPDLLAGHSFGELVALYAAGSIRQEDLLSLSQARGQAIEAASANIQGSMAAVFADIAIIKKTIQDLDVVLANHNAPLQSVIAGSLVAIDRAILKFENLGIRCQKIPVVHAFHSPLIKEAEHNFAQVLEDFNIQAPKLPVYANTTAEVYEGVNIKAFLARHIVEPVQFVRQIEKMYEDGARIFLEIGPGSLLKNLVAQILEGKPHYVQTLDRSGNGINQLLQSLAELAVQGLDLDISALFASRKIQAYDFAKLKNKKVSATLWLVNGQLCKPKSGKIPEGAFKAGQNIIDFSQASIGDIASQTRNVNSASENSVQWEGNLREANLHETNYSREALVKDYIQSMRQMVESQRQVMLQFLGSESIEGKAQIPMAASALSLNASSTSNPQSAAVSQLPNKSEQDKSDQLSASKAKLGEIARGVQQNISSTVIQVMSEKTGYPEEMLGLDLALEADLSIDSIKRVEILAEIGERLGITNASGPSGGIEKLASSKTLRQLIASLEANKAKAEIKSEAIGGTKTETKPEIDLAVATNFIAEANQKSNAAALPVSQFLFRIEDAPLRSTEIHSVDGKSILILEDSKGLHEPLAALLTKQGARVKTIQIGQDIFAAMDSVDGLILLSLVDTRRESQPLEVFKILQEASRRSIQFIIGVTGRGGEFGYSGRASGRTRALGISGLFKSFAKEVSNKVKLIDLDLDEDAEILGQQILTEIETTDTLVEVGYENGQRKNLVAVPLLTELGTDFSKTKLNLDRNSVILMLGGARGIAAKIAIKLAEQFGCRFEVVGRTPYPRAEASETKDIADFQGLRSYFIKHWNTKKPSEIEAECKKIIHNREILKTLNQLEALGGKPGYHSFDVRDKKRLSECIDQLYAHDRIDGVIHAAGVLSDSLHLSKSEKDFSLVFETKVNPAEVLAEKLRDDIKFVALFSSVAGCFGNRGQTDYAAANNALDNIARDLGERVQGRTLSINWGPWAETGMVSAELEREYRKRGIGLIPPKEGSQQFLDELMYGDAKRHQVVIMSGMPESFL